MYAVFAPGMRESGRDARSAGESASGWEPRRTCGGPKMASRRSRIRSPRVVGRVVRVHVCVRAAPCWPAICASTCGRTRMFRKCREGMEAERVDKSCSKSSLHGPRVTSVASSPRSERKPRPTASSKAYVLTCHGITLGSPHACDASLDRAPRRTAHLHPAPDATWYMLTRYRSRSSCLDVDVPTDEPHGPRRTRRDFTPHAFCSLRSEQKA